MLISNETKELVIIFIFIYLFIFFIFFFFGGWGVRDHLSPLDPHIG